MNRMISTNDDRETGRFLDTYAIFIDFGRGGQARKVVSQATPFNLKRKRIGGVARARLRAKYEQKNFCNMPTQYI
jgi:hypothetical protein